MISSHQKLAQQILNKNGASPQLKVDSYFQNISCKVAGSWIEWNFKGSPTWERWAAAVIQKEAANYGLSYGNYDAYYGPMTAGAAEQLIAIYGGKEPVIIKPSEPKTTENKKTQMVYWKPNTLEMMAYYGNRGENLVIANSPFKLKLDWELETKVSRISVHSKIKTKVEDALTEILVYYGQQEIERLGLDRFGGCFNNRKMVGGSEWSTHSWAAALDWYPSQNQLQWGKTKALFGNPDYTKFIDIWEKHGFMSLGRGYNYDWMHFQANPPR